MKNKLLILLLFISAGITAQVKIDSLWKVWKDPSIADTVRMKAMQRICIQGYLYSKPDSAYYYANDLYKLAIKSNSRIFQVSALNIQGASCSMRGDDVHAIEYFTRSLKITEDMGDQKGTSAALNNIGVIYDGQEDYEKAKEYYERALKIIEKSGNKRAIALSYVNLGNVHRSLKEFERSIAYHERSLALSEEIQDDAGTGVALHSMAVAYYEMGDDAKALDLNNRSIPYYEKIGDQQGLMEVYNNLGQVYDRKGDNEKSIAYNRLALRISQEAGVAASVREASKSLYESYKKTGRYKDALEMYESYISMRDSIKNEESQKEMMKQEISYNFEKQKALDEKEHEKELAVAAEKENKQKVISVAVGIGLLLVLLFAVFVVKRLQLTRKQKYIIEQQKDLVEEKQKEILDSITYAKRLQEAILPPENAMKELFPESFILYKPKDIVAGDFYWMEKVGEVVLIAVADCTGHGVPGAMVSVVCSNALNRAVLEFGITDPGKILDKARELVLETFAKSDKDVKDGMDISLASVNVKSAEIKWAGANNPLWYIEGGEFKEITANKQPIGSSVNPQPFTTHTLKLNKGDQFFLFTDGYADQFGGDKGKKFKSRPVKELLLQNAGLPANVQKEKLETIFMNWKTNIEQVDDVCILGVRL
ncbi:MAG: protein serine/threonine phosphatase [Bacteroidetes bacterium]|nr:protein serine/threonine phosphatase [Bacteroidota bacterium]